jgi:hypothetical protein
VLDVLEKMVKELKPGDMIDDLSEEWVGHQTLMLPHLKEEEDIGLPLYRAYFTPKEGAVIVQKIIAGSKAKKPKFEFGSFIYVLGVEKFRNEFMVQESIPGFVWYIDFKSKYKIFVRDFVGNVESLKKGEEPKADNTSCAIL